MQINLEFFFILFIMFCVIAIRYKREKDYEIYIVNKENKNLKIVETILDDRIEKLNSEIINLQKENKFLSKKNERLCLQSKVSNEELNYIVNDSDISYQMDMCHINAFNMDNKLDGYPNRIMIGQASYTYDGNKEDGVTTNHLWNEYFFLENGIQKIQLIDSINHKENESKKYFNHRGIPLNLYDYLGEKRQKVIEYIENNEHENLVSYEDNDIKSVNKKEVRQRNFF
ncbi:MAG: hypothetical protein U9N59_14540 [Campylobacterota bacterium]|nr:hypothetical protein [Campylobacterota bacterium]